MADIKLIDAQGDERTYSGVAKVKIPLADGTGNATFIQLEVATEAEMTALLETAEIGSVFKYTGTTGTYENGALYEVQKATAGEVRRWAKLQSDEWIIDFYIVADANTTLSFKAVDGMKWSEWLVTDYNAQTITTLADGTMVFSDSDVRINADINDYIIAGHTYTVTVPALTSPTIDITDTTLNIYDEEGLATSYDILVDGEVKATVEKVSEATVTITNTSASYNAQYGYSTANNILPDDNVMGIVSAGDSVTFSVPIGTKIGIVADESHYFAIPWFTVTSLSGDVEQPLGSSNPQFLINGDCVIIGYPHDDD